jgi:hypothetical protein
MSSTSDFLIDFERGELCALDRFLECSEKGQRASMLEASHGLFLSALKVMHKNVRSAVSQIEHDTSIGEVSVAMQLLEEQADAAAHAFRRLTVSELDLMLEDEEASNDASVAIWKILDVIGPIAPVFD